MIQNIPTSETLNIEDIKPGMSSSYSKTITGSDVKSYACLSGDNNPVHMSDEYASQSRYGKRIAHGLLSAGFFSAIFGTKLPGPGCVYVSQNLIFKRPVYIGDTVLATVTVAAVDSEKKRVTFNTVCTVRGKLVIEGIAELFIPGKKRGTKI